MAAMSGSFSKALGSNRRIGSVNRYWVHWIGSSRDNVWLVESRAPRLLLDLDRLQGCGGGEVSVVLLWVLCGCR